MLERKRQQMKKQNRQEMRTQKEVTQKQPLKGKNPAKRPFKVKSWGNARERCKKRGSSVDS